MNVPMTIDFDKAIASVAVHARDAEQFRAQARIVAAELGPSCVDALKSRFHAPLKPEPPGFGFEECGLGGWLTIWQFSIFEIYYHIGEAALPALRQVAFGEYDWIQGNAVEILVRLAAIGIDRDRTIADLRRELPRFRYEGVLYSVGPLLSHAESDPAIAEIIRELEDVEAWKEAVDELTQSSSGQ